MGWTSKIEVIGALGIYRNTVVYLGSVPRFFRKTTSSDLSANKTLLIRILSNLRKHLQIPCKGYMFRKDSFLGCPVGHGVLPNKHKKRSMSVQERKRTNHAKSHVVCFVGRLKLCKKLIKFHPQLCPFVDHNHSQGLFRNHQMLIHGDLASRCTLSRQCAPSTATKICAS